MEPTRPPRAEARTGPGDDVVQQSLQKIADPNAPPPAAAIAPASPSPVERPARAQRVASQIASTPSEASIRQGPAAAGPISQAPSAPPPGKEVAPASTADLQSKTAEPSVDDLAPTFFAPLSQASHAYGQGHPPHLGTTASPGAALASGASQQIVQASVQAGNQPVELTLSPEELGKVRLTLHAHDNAITVAVHAERSDTLDLLRRNIDILARDFREIGYGEISFSFSGQGGEQRHPDTPAQDETIPFHERVPPARFQPTPAPALSAARTTSGGLDLRI